MSRLIFTDGQKAANLLNSDDPRVWTFFNNAPQSKQDELYSRVAAVYRSYNLEADTIGNMPFALYDSNGEEYDSSATWKNKVGFLPNPSDLFRLDVLSLIDTNTIYNLRTTDALGYKVRGLYHAISRAFVPVTDPVSGELKYIERRIGTQTERYEPDDKRLFRAWWLDHTTELLPSPYTEAVAIANSAGEIYAADLFIRNFFERGGVKPTIVSIKGMINPTTKEDQEKSWTEFIKNISRRLARIVNGDAVDVKPFGAGVDDLKDNQVYKQALENIAIGRGMPLSLLLANSANMATAQEEKATWYESKIIPRCNWLSYEYNRQIFEPLGLYLQFHPETLDPNQEDETQRSVAVGQYIDVINKCPTYEIFIGMAETMGIEISDSLDSALKQFYADKKERAEAIQVQTQPEPKPVPPIEPAKWIPSLSEYKELDVWQEVALRRLKKGETLDFEYQPHHGGLPDKVSTIIREKVGKALTADEVKAAFVLDLPKIEATDTLALAASLNKLADTLAATKQLPESR